MRLDRCTWRRSRIAGGIRSGVGKSRRSSRASSPPATCIERLLIRAAGGSSEPVAAWRCRGGHAAPNARLTAGAAAGSLTGRSVRRTGPVRVHAVRRPAITDRDTQDGPQDGDEPDQPATADHVGTFDAAVLAGLVEVDGGPDVRDQIRRVPHARRSRWPERSAADMPATSRGTAASPLGLRPR